MKKQLLSAAIIAVAASSANATLYYAQVQNVDIYSSGQFGVDTMYEYSKIDGDGGLASNQFVTPPPIPGFSAFAPGNMVYDSDTGVFAWTGDIHLDGGAAAHEVVLSDGTIDTANILGQPNGITTGSATCIDLSTYGACGPYGWNSGSWNWADLTVTGAGVGSIFSLGDSADWNTLDADLATRAAELDAYGVAFSPVSVLQDSGYHYRMNIQLMAIAPPEAAISAVPVPAAAWLFGSALLGLAGIGRKRKAA
ncbi:VPLPA-CTERM sorting domain-containing protein [Oceanicoccus sp. KOV_DT_Chl]|uniref:VPLPA-CTERM sorting domain-containing protein n=1 Tax=Oceanicoccus sp. KOV_DT_Chl TaxID=1904639 RepID=UPI0011AF3940|nr:VPLPA-CTERM sorting domain-containing protein [Oceanicoccus sp. KOV_DT_Chl]